VYCAKTFDTSVSASPDTTGSAVMEMIFDFKMEYCVDSTYISTNNERFDDFLRLYFYFDKDDFTMVPADVDLTIVHLGLSNDTVYTIAHSVADHTHPTLGDSYRILLNNIRDNTFNDHFKYWERFTFRFSNIKPPPVVRSSTIYFEAKRNAGSEDIDMLDATFTFTPEPGAIFNTGFVLDNELCATCGTTGNVETLELYFTPISEPLQGYWLEITFPQEVTFLSTGPIPCD